MEKAIQFRSGERSLCGILHTPETTSDERTAVVFLNAGLVCRSGPERLYVKAAREFSASGYTCLRFDFPGIGYSAGEVGRINFDLHSDTSCTQRAIDFLAKERGIQDVVLIGMCTGARNAVWTARKDSRVHSLVLLSLPISFDRTRTPLYKIMRSRQDQRRKLRRNRAFGKLKSTAVGELARKAWWSTKGLRYSIHKYPIDALRNLRLFLSGTQTDPIVREGMHRSCQFLMEEGRRIYFIYGVEDRTLVKDFQTFFNAGRKLSALCDYWFEERAGHSISGIAAQNAIIERILKWIKQTDSSPDAANVSRLTAH